MTRVKRSVPARKRTKKLLKATKGYRGTRSTSVKMAKQAYMKAGVNAYRDRRLRRRTMRRLWITRLNAAVRAHGVMYSRFIRMMDDKNITINRKLLSDIAVRNPEVFTEIVNAVKK